MDQLLWISNYMTEFIAAVALLVSLLAYCLNRKLRKEQGQALLFVDLMQIDAKIYAVITNIGKTFAYDVTITVSAPFANRFSNLKLIQPGVTYRYLLLDSTDTADYPESLTFKILYHDYYSKRKLACQSNHFKLLDYLKYDVSYHRDYDVYEINKVY